MINNNDLLPVYQCVLKRLSKIDKTFFYNRDLVDIIIHMKINKKEISMKGVKRELALLGFTRKSIDKICNHIFWKMRYSIWDAVEIKRTLIKKGFLEVKSGNRIYIKNRNKLNS